MTPRRALWFPLFDELADPSVVARLAAEAEEAGWAGVFVWDQVTWRPPVVDLADPWVTLAAIATATESLRFGPLVTPLARRRPVTVARQTATLDRLGGGRLVLGVGLGGDSFAGEFSRTGEVVDDRVRGRMLDEALDVLAAAWSGEPVHHRGEHYVVDGVRFRPRPVRGSVPVWVGGLPGATRPRRRAARHDGFFPVNLRSPDELAEAVAAVDALRTPGTPFDHVAEVAPGADLAPWAAAGATWLLTSFDPAGLSADHVRGVLRDGPA